MMRMLRYLIVGLAAIARGIGTLKPPQMQHSGTVVLKSLVF